MQRVTWKETTAIFFISRIALFLVSGASTLLMHPKADMLAALLAWDRWDANYYARIATQGYVLPSDRAFYPFWPTLEHLLGKLVPLVQRPIANYIAGVFLANVCFFLALQLYITLVSRDMNTGVARRAAWFLSFQPCGFFFALGYGESLFLLCVLATFWFLGREQWWRAGTCGFFATLTRPTGIALLLPFLLLALQHIQRSVKHHPQLEASHTLDQPKQGGFWSVTAKGENKQGEISMRKNTRLLRLRGMTLPHAFTPLRREALTLFLRLSPRTRKALAIAPPMVLIPAGVVAYMLYLSASYGNPLAFSVQEAVFWGRHFSIPGWAFVAALEILLHSGNAPLFVQNGLDLLFSVLPCLVLAARWRTIPLHYTLFATATAVYSLSFPITVKSAQLFVQPLASQPRYMIVAFPIMMALAAWAEKHQLTERAFFAISVPVLVLNMILFSNGFWVA
jgi:hypothetical protein